MHRHTYYIGTIFALAIIGFICFNALYAPQLSRGCATYNCTYILDSTVDNVSYYSIIANNLTLCQHSFSSTPINGSACYIFDGNPISEYYWCPYATKCANFNRQSMMTIIDILWILGLVVAGGYGYFCLRYRVQVAEYEQL